MAASVLIICVLGGGAFFVALLLEIDVNRFERNFKNAFAHVREEERKRKEIQNPRYNSTVRWYNVSYLLLTICLGAAVANLFRHWDFFVPPLRGVIQQLLSG